MWRILTLAGMVACLVAPFLPPSASRPDRPDVGIAVFAGVAAITTAFACGRSRASRIIGAAGAVTGLGWVVIWLVADVQGGVPGAAIGVLAGGLLAVATGAVAGAISKEPRWRAHPVAAGSVVALTAAVTVLVPVVVVDLPVYATTTALAEPAILAERPGTRTWSWQPPAAVLDVDAAGNGVVVAVADGSVVALDGPTGAVRWQYGRAGSHVRALEATPDRDTVLISFDPGGRYDTDSELLVALDASTGVVRHERLIDGGLTTFGELNPTAHTLTLRERVADDHVRLLGYDIATGDLRWTWEPPPGCGEPRSLIDTGRDVVLAPVSCPDRLAVLALDEITGAVRWQYDIPTRPANAQDKPGLERIYLDASPDGTVLSVMASSQRLTGSVADDVLLDAASGAVLTEIDEQQTWPWLEGGPTPLIVREEGANWTAIEAVDPVSRQRRPLTNNGCPIRRDFATTSTSLILACDVVGSRPGDLTVVTQDLAGGPQSRVPVSLGGEDGPASWLFDRTTTAVVPAPGAIVLARATDYDGAPALVLGLALSDAVN